MNEVKVDRGLLALFKDTQQLKKAAELVKNANVQKFDVFTPFPVHGLEKAMGLKRSFLPWVTFGAGLTGCSLGLFFQIWTSAIDWPLNVGGKPYNSIPAFIPVTFELTILFAGLATAAALFVVCGLPKVNPRILHPDLTNDQFGLFISARDPRYHVQQFQDLLKGAGAHEVREV